MQGESRFLGRPTRACDARVTMTATGRRVGTAAATRCAACVWRIMISREMMRSARRANGLHGAFISCGRRIQALKDCKAAVHASSAAGLRV
jgi:hypothetical protein